MRFKYYKRAAWSKTRVDECSGIDEPECWLKMSWRRRIKYSGLEVDCILYARVANVTSIR